MAVNSTRTKQPTLSIIDRNVEKVGSSSNSKVGVNVISWICWNKKQIFKMENYNIWQSANFYWNKDDNSVFQGRSSEDILPTDVSGWYDRIYGPSHHCLFQANEVDLIDKDCKIQGNDFASVEQICVRIDTVLAQMSFEIKENDIEDKWDIMLQKFDLYRMYLDNWVNLIDIKNSYQIIL